MVPQIFFEVSPQLCIMESHGRMISPCFISASSTTFIFVTALLTSLSISMALHSISHGSQIFVNSVTTLACMPAVSDCNALVMQYIQRCGKGGSGHETNPKPESIRDACSRWRGCMHKHGSHGDPFRV